MDSATLAFADVTAAPLGANPTKPLLRGWLHLMCFFAAFPAGAAVVGEAASPEARLGASVYAAGLVALFGVSGFYHRLRWSPEWRARMSRLDHTTIFLMIAASYTPICLVVLDGWVRTAMLVIAWAGAAFGGVLAWLPGARNRRLCSGLYIALGWAVLAAGPQLLERMSAQQLGLITVGGVLFTIGSITLASHRPDPFPCVFGYHEVWHVFVVCAVFCQLVAIASLVSQPNTV